MTCVIWKPSSSACWICLAFCPGCLSHNNKAGFFSAVVHTSESNGNFILSVSAQVFQQLLLISNVGILTENALFIESSTCSVINYNSVDVFDYRAISCVVLFHNLVHGKLFSHRVLLHSKNVITCITSQCSL